MYKEDVSEYDYLFEDLTYVKRKQHIDELNTGHDTIYKYYHVLLSDKTLGVIFYSELCDQRDELDEIMKLRDLYDKIIKISKTSPHKAEYFNGRKIHSPSWDDENKRWYLTED